MGRPWTVVPAESTRTRLDARATASRYAAIWAFVAGRLPSAKWLTADQVGTFGSSVRLAVHVAASAGGAAAATAARMSAAVAIARRGTGRTAIVAAAMATRAGASSRSTGAWRTAVAYPGLLLTRTVALSLLVMLLPAAGARAAGDPIMPLAQVTPGMHCTGYSVVRGTTISPFSVDVVDVLADNGGEGARILFTVSGPAVDKTGIGPGFSGSPIYCPGPGGQMLNAGAISEGIGQYGNNVGLATPIEQMLGEPVVPPASARRDPALLRSAVPLSEPLSITGLSTPLASALQRAASSVGRVVYAAPSAPRDVATFPVQTLVPGASVAVGYSTGAIAAGAIGTVTYVDGNSLWAFGHDLAGAGRRSLFLQDAYVYTIVSNPLGTADTSSYKLAAPGHAVGLLSDDTPDAVAGTLGVFPRSFPLHVVARDLDAHKTITLDIDGRRRDRRSACPRASRRCRSSARPRSPRRRSRRCTARRPSRAARCACRSRSANRPSRCASATTTSAARRATTASPPRRWSPTWPAR